MDRLIASQNLSTHRNTGSPSSRPRPPARHGAPRRGRVGVGLGSLGLLHVPAVLLLAEDVQHEATCGGVHGGPCQQRGLRATL